MWVEWKRQAAPWPLNARNLWKNVDGADCGVGRRRRRENEGRQEGKQWNKETNMLVADIHTRIISGKGRRAKADVRSKIICSQLILCPWRKVKGWPAMSQFWDLSAEISRLH